MTNALLTHVTEYATERAEENETTLQATLEEIAQHGCISGMIGHLIYHTDTTQFYDTYKTEIETLIQELEDGTGESRTELFKGDLEPREWFSEDDDVITIKKNLLAWFGFEETCNNILRELEEA